jgi:hypothetical protein
MASQISKKRKFVADGVFRAELNEFFMRELAEEGYSGCDVRVTHARTEVCFTGPSDSLHVLIYSDYQIIIRATHTQEVLGEKGRRIRELTALVQKRFKYPENSLELYAEKVQYRGLSAIAQCESLRYKLLGGLAVRRLVPYLDANKSYSLNLTQCLLWRPPIRHGVWCQGLRSGRLRKTSCCTCKIHEVH